MAKEARRKSSHMVLTWSACGTFLEASFKGDHPLFVMSFKA